MKNTKLKCETCKQIKFARNQLASIENALSSAKTEFDTQHWTKCATYWKNEITRLEEVDPETIIQKQKAAEWDANVLTSAKFIEEKLGLVYKATEELRKQDMYYFERKEDGKLTYQVVLDKYEVLMVFDKIVEALQKLAEGQDNSDKIRSLDYQLNECTFRVGGGVFRRWGKLDLNFLSGGATA